MLASIGLFGWAYSEFHTNQTTIVPRQTPDYMLTEGPFSYTRNPMYLAMVLLTLGVGVFMGAAIAYLPSAFLAYFLHYNYVLPEERKLKEAFGEFAEEYIEYTPAWIGIGDYKI